MSDGKFLRGTQHRANWKQPPSRLAWFSSGIAVAVIVIGVAAILGSVQDVKEGLRVRDEYEAQARQHENERIDLLQKKSALERLEEAGEALREQNEKIRAEMNVDELPPDFFDSNADASAGANGITIDMMEPADFSLEIGNATTAYLIMFEGPGYSMGVNLNGSIDRWGDVPDDFDIEFWRLIAEAWPTWKEEACRGQNDRN